MSKLSEAKTLGGVSSMASKLGVSIFCTSGLLYLIGAALTIVLVGFLLIFVALILNVVWFFSIPDKAPMTAPYPPPLLLPQSRSPAFLPPS